MSELKNITLYLFEFQQFNDNISPVTCVNFRWFLRFVHPKY